MHLGSVKCVRCGVRKDQHAWSGEACEKFVWPQEESEETE